jgi:predicted alpha-1,6-mannanase (GH76 family)
MHKVLLMLLVLLGWGSLASSRVQLKSEPSKPDPEVAMQDFLRAYWDADKGYFLAWNRLAPFTRPSGAGPEGGKYSDFWWEAQLWDLVLDAYERNPSEQYRQLIDEVYDGFVEVYPNFQNDFNDDLAWWAQASMRAYKHTQNPRYLERAKTLFEDIWTYWTPEFGGGVKWRRSTTNQKNVATNGPLTVIAVRLYQATNDPSYLERAQQLWDFVDKRLTDGDSRVYDNWEGNELRRWDFTYNVGNFVLASLALREVVSDEARKATLLERTVKATNWMLENLTNAGILLDEGTGDGGGFKGVTMRALKALTNAPGLEASLKTRYENALRDNATQVWNSRREADGLVGSDWASVQERGVIESLAAGSAITALQVAPSALEARFVGGDGRYEAENSLREGVASSINAPGYSGRGYVNNFSRDGQLVTFRVNVPEAKRYTLRFQYSAGGGTATRQIRLGETNAPNLEFTATPSWQTWAQAETSLELTAGANAITVKFDRDSGSKGWLNLDRLQIVGLP